MSSGDIILAVIAVIHDYMTCTPVLLKLEIIDLMGYSALLYQSSKFKLWINDQRVNFLNGPWRDKLEPYFHLKYTHGHYHTE